MVVVMKKSIAMLVCLMALGCSDSGSKNKPDPVDSDNDLVIDSEDNCPAIANADQADLDSDSIGDVCDDDRDGDSVSNTEDLFPDDPSESADSDGDTVGDNADAFPNNALYQQDSDNDQMPNKWEEQYGLAVDSDDAQADGDSDQLTNLAEFQASTNPTISDTDGDTYLDGFEVQVGLDPLLESGPEADTDFDGVPNRIEIDHSTDPMDASDFSEAYYLLSYLGSEISKAPVNYAAADAIGRYVVYSAKFDSIDATYSHIFLKDMKSGETTVISKNSDGTLGNGDSTYVAISNDGRFITFSTAATNLVSGDGNSDLDTILYDRMLDQFELVSLDESGNNVTGEVRSAAISNDGNVIAFQTTKSLVALDAGSDNDIYIYYRQSGNLELVSKNIAGTAEATGGAYTPLLSAAGDKLIFSSRETDLHACSTSTDFDSFAFDIETKAIECISNGNSGNGDNSVRVKAVTPDFQKVLVRSEATNLDASDVDGFEDIFVKDSLTSLDYDLVSQNSSGTKGNSDSDNSIIDSLGSYVAFDSNSTNLIASDTDIESDVYLKDIGSALSSSELTLVSVSHDGTKASSYSFLIDYQRSFTKKFLLTEDESSNIDSKSDGVVRQLYYKRLNLLRVDTDGDGLYDAEEAYLLTNASLTDTDSDGLSDYEEVYTHQTSAVLADTDGDGTNDKAELDAGTNPFVAN